ncbi:hypothetical protein R5R35_014062 [Gryllus longicercus]|uniref:Uncharacterized protein n=1 Tax=Gryllus longicercus TaxID=2509291 RepID=A0AAN9VUS2_9ORTH
MLLITVLIWRDYLPESGQSCNKNFLENHNIPFRADALHQELFALASSNKPEKGYRVDNIINAAGHTVL